MTNQEAIEILKKYKDESEEDYYVKRAKALGKGIEALENQKSFIDELEKIKEEIEALDKWGETYHRYNLALGDCIEIIDKHISELKGE